MVSSRSSVPSSAKYDDWIGISRCVAATSALTVSRPERRRAIDDDVRGTARSSVVELVLQAERRVELARHPRLELGERDARRRDRQVRRAASARSRRASCTSVSTKTSYMLFVDVAESTNDMLLLPCGSRSMSSVLLAAHGQGGGEVDGGRRLADAAFLIGDGENHSRRSVQVPTAL